VNEYWQEQFAKWRAEAAANGFAPFSDEELDSLARGLQDGAEGRVRYIDLGLEDEDGE
jgi:hypothetical protein